MTATIGQVGVHEGVPHEVYIADPVPGGSLSSTGAKRLLPPSCPAKYRWYADHPQVKHEFDLGHAAHLHVLGAGAPIEVIQKTTTRTDPKTKEIVTTVEDAGDRRTDSAKKHEVAIRTAGRMPLLASELADVRAMAAAIRRDELAMALLDDDLGQAEVTLVAQDPRTGVMLRARIDWLRQTEAGRVRAVDYKTTTCAEPEALRRQMYSYGYHVQSAFYLYVLRLLGLAGNGSRFVFLAQEKEPPYLTSAYEPDPEALAVGLAKVERAIEIYHDCKAADVWPGYSDEVLRLSLPRYALTEREDWS